MFTYRSLLLPLPYPTTTPILLTLTYSTLPYPILTYPILPYPTLPYSTPPCCIYSAPTTTPTLAYPYPNLHNV